MRIIKSGLNTAKEITAESNQQSPRDPCLSIIAKSYVTFSWEIVSMNTETL
jgi:hypothetical protein